MIRAALAVFLILAPSWALAACRDDRVSLRGPWGQAAFTVEVADDVGERAQGLMHRESMPAGAGMLFVYDRPQHARFWMRNTLIPLDMIFADSTGLILRIHENAIPLDETVIDGGEGVSHVLEINGGLSARLGLTAGSEIQHPTFKNSRWPCD